jgi:hypothetical protein
MEGFNGAIGEAFPDMERFDRSSTSGVFRVKWSKDFFYYVTELGTTVSAHASHEWSLERETDLLRSTRSQGPAPAGYHQGYLYCWRDQFAKIPAMEASVGGE